MSYQAITINKIITDIDQKKYLLPSIQREFVWGTDQITKLFDSLLMDYPINSFLFWEVPKEKTLDFKFYEFIREYHQRNKIHNPKANLNGSDDIKAVLDGQQRLTSLYIGLKGTYATKLPHKQYNNPEAYPIKKLYINLFKLSQDISIKYDLKFLTEKEANEKTDENYWFEVGKIMNLKQQYDVMEYMIENDLSSNPNKEKAKLANEILSKLHSVIHVKPLINYYLEESLELDKVLNVFIRINSGGTALSYSDLLLSFATSQWETRDAREVITKFVDEINQIGRGFNINKDIVLKACLVICDLPDISFKVDNFNRTNMNIIESKWENIVESIKNAVGLISSFGFARENITSNNLIIPIAYYLNKIQKPINYQLSSQFKEDREKIKSWLISSLLKKVFSFAPDGALKPIREIINENYKEGFPLEKICNRFKGTNRSLNFTEDDIINLLYAKYGHGDTLVIMSLLYPWADLRNNFHVDHVFPKSHFTLSKLKKQNISEEKIENFMKNYNYIGNLQLLEGLINIEKKDTTFEKWISSLDKEILNNYKEKHLIPNIDFSLENYDIFLEKREELIKNKLLSILKR